MCPKGRIPVSIPAPDIDAFRNQTGTAAPDRSRLTLDLLVATPIMGGGAKLASGDDGRYGDSFDRFRVPSIRGQLRFWWRATEGARFETAEAMRQEELDLWGGIGWEDAEDRDERGRPRKKCRQSQVSITVSALRPDTSNEENYLYDRPNMGDTLAYATFPAQPNNTGFEGVAQLDYRRPLTLRFEYPTEQKAAIFGAVSAWLLFGGYGGRTRRGMGTLCCQSSDDAEFSNLLPTADNFHQLVAWFRGHVFNRNADVAARHDWPVLAGSHLFIAKNSNQDACESLITAVKTLREFRQGFGIGRRENPNEHGAARFSESLWPEAYSMRKLAGRPDTYYNHRLAPPATLAAFEAFFPRAQFGLPIQIKFHPHHEQDQAANGSITFEGRRPEERTDRLASNLIVKALAVRSNNSNQIRYWPIALVLNAPRASDLDGVAVKLQTGRVIKLRPDQIVNPTLAHNHGGMGGRLKPFNYSDPATGDALEAYEDYLNAECHFDMVTL